MDRDSNHEVSVEALVEKAGHAFSAQACQQDLNLHYSIYYPQQFNEKEKFPVLILFDPQGDSDFPLTMYASLADKYGFILMASADSKNGNSAEQTANIVQSILLQTITT